MLLNLTDDTAPQVSGISGPFDGDYHGGAQRISYTAHDGGSGVKTAQVLVNGTVGPTVDYTDCALVGRYATQVAPCPGDRSGALDVLPSAFHDGSNAVQVCVWGLRGRRDRQQRLLGPADGPHRRPPARQPAQAARLRRRGLARDERLRPELGRTSPRTPRPSPVPLPDDRSRRI